GHDRRSPDLRRVRLHEGVPGREADAGREALPDLRGHLADPAARDRTRNLPAARALSNRLARALDSSPLRAEAGTVPARVSRSRRRTKRSRLLVQRALVALAVAALLALVLGLVFAGSAQRLASGVRIAGIDVGGLTP